jgi:succinate dehydrogenase/fumarate reductase flavoprotein subunit
MEQISWEHTSDIVVVGSGAAAYSAAVTAHVHGAGVVMLEKSSLAGGTTIRSGGGFWIPNNRFQRQAGIDDKKEDAVRYMARYSFPQFYNPNDARLGLPQNEYNLISTYYDMASAMLDFMWDNGAVKSVMQINWTGKPQVDYMEQLPENRGIRGRVCYSMDEKGKLSQGAELIRQLKGWADSHQIPLMLNRRVAGILRNPKGEVVGVEAVTSDNKKINFRAKKAVIFATGGFTHNDDLMLHFHFGPHFGGCAAPTSTGDFVLMASAIGAELGNMPGAFRAELVLEQALADPGGPHNVWWIVGDSMLEVNRYGRRYGDEKRNYHDRAMTHFVWDPLRCEWSNMITFMIYDQRSASLWQGFPPLPPQGFAAPYVISGATFDELAANIQTRLASLAAHTGGFNVDDAFAANLKETVARFNAFAESGVDAEFKRGDFDYDREWSSLPPFTPGTKWPPEGSKNYTMYPLSQSGPYYAVILGSGTLDTNGGPLINPKAQVLDTKRQPIPGLYGAGDCIASPTGNAYWGGGSTIGPALTYGHIAGLNAANESAKPD